LAFVYLEPCAGVAFNVPWLGGSGGLDVVVLGEAPAATAAYDIWDMADEIEI
jgi:hypothetical protein